MQKLQWLILNLIFLLHGMSAQSQTSPGIEVISYIQENKIDSVEYFLEQGNDVNGIYPRNTLLEIAIANNKLEVVNLLIKHQANVNLQNNKTTPLFLSVIYGHKYESNKIVETLININANVNFVGVNGYTPLILACKINNSVAAKFLFENNADTSIRDRFNNDFFCYVLRGSDPSLISYFHSRGFKIPRMSNTKDGPYLQITDNDELLAYYMSYDSLSDQTKWSTEDEEITVNGFPSDQAIGAFLGKDQLVYNDTFRKAGNIFVISDIHGHYNSFVRLLNANKIINKNLEWTFGQGHLVIAGDVFDRGEKVTECLWLIFALEFQAEKSGGMVHYLLGNHELMILKDNDKSYANEKYILPYAKMGLDYHDLFNEESVLGRWIRSKNIAVKINKNLFVHGGIPPEYAIQRRTIKQMNQSVNEYMSDTSNQMLDASNQIIEPTWYRDYFSDTDLSNEILKLIKFYKVEKIIVGHTPVDQIKTLQDNIIIGIGIHFGDPGRPAEGLLISGNNYYRCDERGNKTRF